MRTILFGLLVVAVLGCSGNESAADPVEESAPTKSADLTAKTVTVTPPPPPAPPSIDPDELAVVHEYTQMFYRGEIDLLHAKFSDELRESLTLAQLSTLYEHVGTTFGKEQHVLLEDSQRNEEYRAFARFARFDKTEEVIEIQWILKTADAQVAGFFIRPAKRKIEAVGSQ